MATAMAGSVIISEVQKPSQKDCCCIGDEDTNALKSKTNSGTVLPSQDARSHLSHAARVALALNDDCCDIGVGKMYLWTLYGPDEDLKSNKKAYAACCTMPQLIYLSQRWDKESQEEWRSQTTRDRLLNMMIQGSILPSMMVIGIRIEEFGTFDLKIKLDRYTEAAVTIIMSPSTYVGPTRKMREKLSYGSSQSLLITEASSGDAGHRGYLDDIKSFKVNNLAGDGRCVIEWLESHSCDLTLLESFDKLFPHPDVVPKETKNTDRPASVKPMIVLPR